jgi:uncharacterized membrane protein
MVIFLNIPLLREIVAFTYLSFIPGFVTLKLFKLKELGLLQTFLLSVGLSLAASMFVGLIVNQLFILLGFSQPLSIIPLTAGICIFTLVIFSIAYRNDFSINTTKVDALLKELKNHLPLTLMLVILPIIGAVAALYVNVSLMIVLCVLIAFICILCVVSTKIIPTKFYPLVLLSVSLSVLIFNLFITKYIVGDDATIEFYVYKLTQLRGYWGPINELINSGQALFYNSMLSVTLLPNFYSVLMGLENELLFRFLYLFLSSLIPVALYVMFRNQTGKLLALLSVFFLIFTKIAFFGELIGVNRQIVAEFFLIISIFLWIDKTLPITQKRILIIIFGVSIALSHYSIALLYVVFISVIVLISSLKPRFDDTFNSFTVITIFGITFVWYAFTTTSILTPIISNIRMTLTNLTVFQYDAGAGSVSAITSLPEVFTTATWINIGAQGIVNLLLVLGILVVVFASRKIGLSDKYKILTLFGGLLFVASLLFPSIAVTLNFSRFYAIALLLLSPCFVIGIIAIERAIKKITSRQKLPKSNDAFLTKYGKTSLLLAAMLLGGYFFSQSGFVNYVTGGDIHSYTFDYYKVENSTDPVVVSLFYSTHVQEQDAYSADWVLRYANTTSVFYSRDNNHALVSRGLVPGNLIHPILNTTTPWQNSFVYLDSLLLVKGVPAGLFNASEVTPVFSECHLIYSNGNSEVWRAK